MHHMGELLHVHQLCDLHSAWLAHPAEVVPSQVDQHDMLGALFLAALQFSLVGVVLTRCRTAGPRASDRMGRRFVTVDSHHCLDSGAHDLKAVQVQIVHIGRGVDAAE